MNLGMKLTETKLDSIILYDYCKVHIFRLATMNKCNNLEPNLSSLLSFHIKKKKGLLSLN